MGDVKRTSRYRRLGRAPDGHEYLVSSDGKVYIFLRLDYMFQEVWAPLDLYVAARLAGMRFNRTMGAIGRRLQR